jgi:putative GTP pyrophosphokinase
MRQQSPFWDEYARNEHLYADLAPRLERLIADLLAAEGLRIHSISSRLRKLASIERKVGQSEAGAAPTKYQRLSELTDLLGVRIITYFPDEVDRAASIITREFTIDEENSIDKRAVLDPDRFGYLSLHYVAELSPTRRALIEYQRFSVCCFEIQIRSLLQHAWAEIEHDLGYRTEAAIPREARRRFSRLAGLLEIADTEFAHLRDDLTRYEAEIPRRLENEPETVFIDRDSTLLLIESSLLVHELDERIAHDHGEVLGAASASYAEKLSAWLQFAGADTVEEVTQALEKYREVIPAFVTAWLARPTLGSRERPFGGDVSRGISLFYLVYLLVAERRSETFTLSYLTFARMGPADREQLAQDLMEITDPFLRTG